MEMGERRDDDESQREGEGQREDQKQVGDDVARRSRAKGQVLGRS
jgi:hypothetical protein